VPPPLPTSTELEDHVTSYGTAEDRSLVHGGALVFFDGPLERLDVVRAVARAALAYDELRQKPTSLPLAADVLGWSADAGFRASKQVNVVEIDDVRDERALARAVARIWSRPLPADRPPWELTLFSDRNDQRTTVLIKAHRALLDTIGATALARRLLGTPISTVAPRLLTAETPRPGIVPALLSVASALADQGARRSRALASEVRDMLRPGVALSRTREIGRILESAGTLLSSPAPETPWNGALGPERRVAWLALSRDVLRGVEEMFGGSWQDAWLTIVADALGRYLRGRGRTTSGLTLLAYLPAIGVPPSEATPPGHDAARLVGLPVDEMPPAARYAAVLKGSVDPLAAARGSGLEQLARVSQRLPAPLQSLLGSLCYQAANTVLVADRPLDEPLLLGDRRVTSMVPLAALPWHVGLAFAALEWDDDEILIGVTAEAFLVPQVGSLLAALHDAYVELAAAAGVPPLEPARFRRAR
jgi:diacylglycerol O-acyltransferase